MHLLECIVSSRLSTIENLRHTCVSNSSLRPVAKRTAESLAVEALKRHLLSGSAVPGQRLTETVLAARLCVSRATVRTALHQLTLEGLVHQIPYTGWEVARLGAKDAWELYTLRSGLEALAARLAAAHRGHATEGAATNALLQLERACHDGDRSNIADADFELHKTIIGLAHHRRLLEQYRLIEQQTRLYIRSSDALILAPTEVLAQHAPIVDAIIRGRPELAARLSEQHNLGEGKKLVTYLKSHEAHFHDAPHNH